MAFPGPPVELPGDAVALLLGEFSMFANFGGFRRVSRLVFSLLRRPCCSSFQAVEIVKRVAPTATGGGSASAPGYKSAGTVESANGFVPA